MPANTPEDIKEMLRRAAFKLKIHGTVFLIGIAFATLAYGFIHLLVYAIRAFLPYL